MLVTSANMPANTFICLFSCPAQRGEEALELFPKCRPQTYQDSVVPGARMSHRTHNCGVREQPAGRALATCRGPAKKASYQRAGFCVFYFVLIDYYINIKYY